jgi:hypothetical protein
MKKAVCITALLFSNIILLVHAAVPHHYHGDAKVCFTSHCQDSAEAHQHNRHDSQNHQHEGNPSLEICSVDEAYTTANNIVKTACNNVCCLHFECDCEHILHTLILDNFSISDFVDCAKVPFQLKPYFSFFLTEYVGLSLGLRAPPFLS